MPGLSVDTSTWPIWAILILVTISTLQKPLSALLPESVRDFFNRLARKQEHAQTIEESLVNHRFQTDVTEQLRKSWREEQFAEMLHQKDSYLYEYLDKKIDTIGAGQQRITEKLGFVEANTRRTNDLLTTIHIELSKIADRVKGR